MTGETTTEHVAVTLVNAAYHLVPLKADLSMAVFALIVQLIHQGLTPDDIDSDDGRDAVHAVATIAFAGTHWKKIQFVILPKSPWHSVMQIAQRLIDGPSSSETFLAAMAKDELLTSR